MLGLGVLVPTPAASQTAPSTEVITNGGFETGDFTGWTRQVWPNSNGDLRVTSATTGFISGFPVPGSASGSYYALTDQISQGAYALSQSFTVDQPVSQALLTFSISVANRSTVTTAQPHFDPATRFGLNQYASVDLFAGLVSGFTPRADALQTFYLGSTVSMGTVPFTTFTFDITSLLADPGTYTLRFAEVDNAGFFNMAVDDVSLVLSAGTVSTVPEPATWALMATGLLVLAWIGRRRRLDERRRVEGLTAMLAVAALASGLLASPAEAQGGWRDRLKRAAAGAAGVGGVVEAKEALDAAREMSAVTRTASPLAGTYRLTYVYDGTDSITYAVRTFERPTVGHVGGPANRPTGYTLTTVAARTLEELPARWEDVAERRETLGGGPLVVWPFGGDSITGQRFVASWIVALPKGLSQQTDVFRERVSDLHEGRLVRVDGSKLSGYDEVEEADAFGRITPSAAVTLRYDLERRGHRLTVRAERLSTVRLTKADADTTAR